MKFEVNCLSFFSFRFQVYLIKKQNKTEKCFALHSLEKAQTYKNEAFKLNTFKESTELNIVQCLIFGCSTSNIQSRRDPWHRLLDAR